MSEIHECPFLQVSTVERRFVVVSRLCGRLGHWDYVAGGFRHCSDQECHFCREGMKAETRWILRLEEADGSNYLLWTRKRHQLAMERLGRCQKAGLSCEVAIWRGGSAKNSPVQFHILAEVACPELWQVENLIETLMLPSVDVVQDGIGMSINPF